MGLKFYLSIAVISTAYLVFQVGAFGFLFLISGVGFGFLIYGRRGPQPVVFERAPHDPSSFEMWCASCLSRDGWRVEHIGKTGDFGADVLAWRDNDIIVVQCKDHGSPVGISGVQQVSSARMHYGASRAALVATSGFTVAAMSLAKTNNVLLLSPNDIATGNSN